MMTSNFSFLHGRRPIFVNAGMVERMILLDVVLVVVLIGLSSIFDVVIRSFRVRNRYLYIERYILKCICRNRWTEMYVCVLKYI